MDQVIAFDILKTGRNVFITGSAGTGKTFLINDYVRYLREHAINPSIVAPTGIAASHIGGVTIHSFFGVGIKEILNDFELDELSQREYLYDRFRELKILIIDEISMVSPALFQTMDQILRIFKNNDQPFGGIQVVASGDFFQLPPISKINQGIRYAFQTQSWQELKLKTCYLEKKYRQNDDVLINILDQIRTNSVTEETVEVLNNICRTDVSLDEKTTRLFTHNIDVDHINNQELNRLDHKSHVFHSKNKGPQKEVDRIFNTCFAVPELKLKKEAIVIFIKNNPDQGYINGTLGEVIGFNEFSGCPIVKTFDDQEIVAEPVQWEVENKKNEIVATIHQVPLKLAWALTVHKSQGMTLDSAQVDLSKTFEVGQGYVALSRIKSISGLKLLGFNQIALQVDNLILQQDNSIKRSSDITALQFDKLSKSEKQEMFETFILKSNGRLQAGEIKRPIKIKPKVKKGDTLKLTKKLLAQKKSLEEIAAKRKLSLRTIYGHINKIADQESEFEFSHIKPESKIIKQVEKAVRKVKSRKKAYDMLANGKIKLRAIYNELNEEISFEDIQLALLFIK